jgi:hypothetical protein
MCNGELPDPHVCRSRAVDGISDVRYCLVDSPRTCPFALAYASGYLCRRLCQKEVNLPESA